MKFFFFGGHQSLGLDLGTANFRFASCGKSGRIAHLDQYELLPERSDWKEVPDDSTLQSRLKEIREKNSKHLEGKPALAAVSRRTIRGYTELHPDARQDPTVALASAVRHETPLSLKDVHLSFVEVDPLEDSSKFGVYWTAIRKDEAAALQSTLEGAGFEVKGLQCPTLALARFFRLNRAPEANSCHLYINVGFAYTDVLLLKGGQPYQARTIEVAGRNFTYSVQMTHQCGWPEAKKSRLELDLRERSFHVEPAVEDWVRQLRSTVRSFKRLHRSLEIEGVVVCGGTASQPGLAERLEEELKLPVERDRFVRLSTDGKTAESSLGYETALGLALPDSEVKQ